MSARPKKFDFDAALAAAEPDGPIPGKRVCELQHPLVHEWVRKCYERQVAGRLTWNKGRALILEACKQSGLPPIRSSAAVIAAYARRKFGPDA